METTEDLVTVKEVVDSVFTETLSQSEISFRNLTFSSKDNSWDAVQSQEIVDKCRDVFRKPCKAE